MYKNIIIVCSILFSLSSFSADKQLHKNMSLILNSYQLPSMSTTPNKVVVYLSKLTNPDEIDYQEVNTNGDVSSGSLRISRPTGTVWNKVPIGTISSCRADKGSVQITPTELIVYTNTLPITVFCNDSTGVYRESYRTIQK